MCELSVLIVDDSAVFRKAAQNLIASLHGVASVECASSGAEALTRAAELHPDLVLMDIMTFGMSGLEAMRVLRDRVPALKSGASGLIPKKDFATAVPELLPTLVKLVTLDQEAALAANFGEGPATAKSGGPGSGEIATIPEPQPPAAAIPARRN